MSVRTTSRSARGRPAGRAHGRTRRAALALSALLALGGCSGNADTEERLFVFLEDLAPLEDTAAADASGSTFEYALWGDDGLGPVPLERFSTRTGKVNLSLDLDDIDALRTLMVTLERVDDASATPSRSVLLAGDLIDGRSTLSVEHELALGTAFEAASGTFRLATPTSLSDDDFDLGLWWYDLYGDQPGQSLFLPDLPQGWRYEGWIIGGESPLSTGKFSDPGRFDQDNAGAAAGDIEPPPFPGQDFVFNPVLLVGKSAVVTVEPNPDTSLAPFGLRVLLDQVIEEVRVNQPMENVAFERLPVGRVSTNLRP